MTATLFEFVIHTAVFKGYTSTCIRRWAVCLKCSLAYTFSTALVYGCMHMHVVQYMGACICMFVSEFDHVSVFLLPADAQASFPLSFTF